MNMGSKVKLWGRSQNQKIVSGMSLLKPNQEYPIPDWSKSDLFVEPKSFDDVKGRQLTI